ncbi:anthranilate synthase component I [Erythrobacter litoralis]|uniref:anthranilate synthase component I n=1 Tax=Erythrobacter litoralis TaxID=39960 RepID=UPI002434D20B|nr:anthranilate synthase component I [Erythrobacter litoralis]MDG6078222.1 anthranilate synthase component I [Erythrobacter litoralis]
MSSSLGGSDAALEAFERGQPALVWRKVVSDTVTPVGAASQLMEEGRGDFLLESVEGGETRGRYTILGLDPDLVFRADGDQAHINRSWQTDKGAFRPSTMGSLKSLRSLLEECRTEVDEALPPALPLLVGYFGYETISLVEKVPRREENPLDIPDMLFMRPTVLLVFDGLADTLYCVVPIWPKEGLAQASIDLAGRRIQEVVDRLKTGRSSSLEPEAAEQVEIAQTHALSADRYRDMVLHAKEYIAAGDIFQVVLSQRFTTPFTLSPMALYRALRRVNPSPFMFFLDFPGFAVVGSSPEILVRVRDGDVTIRPIAGTRPRGRNAEEDDRNERELLDDAKERAEHLMLLDLGRNDVGRVAERGTVGVTQSFTVERYSHVMHIVSEVSGKLSEAHDAIDAMFAGFPAGTVSGAPKLRACEIIAELEPVSRGPYAGGVGYFGPDGSIDSCIVLRTAVIKDGTMHVQAGAGIVADSDPAYEQRECEAKAGALFAAAREAVRLAATPEGSL